LIPALGVEANMTLKVHIKKAEKKLPGRIPMAPDDHSGGQRADVPPQPLFQPVT
jgi:hypothetical protein